MVPLQLLYLNALMQIRWTVYTQEKQLLDTLFKPGGNSVHHLHSIFGTWHPKCTWKWEGDAIRSFPFLPSSNKWKLPFPIFQISTFRFQPLLPSTPVTAPATVWPSPGNMPKIAPASVLTKKDLNSAFSTISTFAFAILSLCWFM